MTQGHPRLVAALSEAIRVLPASPGLRGYLADLLADGRYHGPRLVSIPFADEAADGSPVAAG